MRLIERFQMLATAPDGIARLRELILSLAVTGKLVPQDPSDEPASALLKKIRTEKDRLIAEGKIKRDKPLSDIGDEGKRFSLAAGWKWVRLNHLVSKLGAGSTPLGGKDVYVDQGIKFLRSQNVWNDGLRLDAVAFITPETHAGMAGTVVSPGDILFNITGASIGRCAVVPSEFDEANVSQHVAIVRPLMSDITPYLHLVLVSPHVQQTVMDVQVGVSREGLSMNKLGQFGIPVPPLPEQSRIVAKVDELMQLCDQLEARGRLEAEQHARLTATLFEALAASESSHALAENWARVAAHFELLLDRPEAVDALEQTIVQLAVRGLLVPQDPNDEPVDVLLNRIRLERNILVAAGKTKPSKAHTETRDEDRPFEPPTHWAWHPLAELTLTGPNNGYSPKPSPTDTGVRCLSLSATTKGYFKDDCFKFVDIPVAMAEQYFLKSGDLLIQRANSLDYVGIAAVYDLKDDLFMYPDLMMRLRLSSSVNVRYIHAYLVSSFGRQYFKGKATGTQGTMPKINQGAVVNMPIPIPPAAEQARIVARVGQLRGLCADLRQRLTERQACQARLADALVGEATAIQSFASQDEPLATVVEAIV